MSDDSIKQRRAITYKFHHAFIALVCVFAIICVCGSIVSIMNGAYTRHRRNYSKRSTHLIAGADVTHGRSTDKSVERNRGNNFNSESRQYFGSEQHLTDIPLVRSKNRTVVKSEILGPESSDYSSLQRHLKRHHFSVTQDEDEVDISQLTEKFEKHNSDKNESKVDNKERKPKKESAEIPELPENYHATGILIMPHSNIAEPFEIWYAPRVHKSRIDYYYGTDRTFQRADLGAHGMAYKYVPMYNDVQGSFDGCWTVAGTTKRPIIPQVITPNITWFKYNTTEVYTGAMTTKWTYQYYAFGMRNHQSVWITTSKPHRPIRYEMFGFDMMLGSYYDHYVLEYISFEDWDGDQEIFELPEGVLCYNWSASLADSLRVNPMQEFTAFSVDKAINPDERYMEYKAMHSKPDPADEKERIKRKHIYKHNVRYVHSHNRRNLSFKLKENHLLDLMKNEMNVLHSSLEKDDKKHKGIRDLEKVEKNQKESDSPPPDVEVPDELDWRNFGAVTSVKGQGICGSCYAFTAVAAAEGAWYRKTGKLVEVSAQQLVDCSWGYGNHGCKGGHYAAALSWIFVHGISTQESYGKYLAQEGYCHFNDTWFGAKIDGFSYIQPWNKTALKVAVAKYGPVAISLNTSPLSFKFYSHGIYSDLSCSSNNTGHSALVIGYGSERGLDYWLIKNSWSSSWGENGYIKISMDENLCGVTEYPVAVIINHPQFHLPTTRKVKPTEDRSDGKSSQEGKWKEVKNDEQSTNEGDHKGGDREKEDKLNEGSPKGDKATAGTHDGDKQDEEVHNGDKPTKQEQRRHEGDKQNQEVHNGDKPTKGTYHEDKQDEEVHNGDKPTKQEQGRHEGDKQDEEVHNGDKPTKGTYHGDKQDEEIHNGDKPTKQEQGRHEGDKQDEEVHNGDKPTKQEQGRHEGDKQDNLRHNSADQQKSGKSKKQNEAKEKQESYHGNDEQNDLEQTEELHINHTGAVEVMKVPGYEEEKTKPIKSPIQETADQSNAEYRNKTNKKAESAIPFTGLHIMDADKESEKEFVDEVEQASRDNDEEKTVTMDTSKAKKNEDAPSEDGDESFKNVIENLRNKPKTESQEMGKEKSKKIAAGSETRKKVKEKSTEVTAGSETRKKVKKKSKEVTTGTKVHETTEGSSEPHIPILEVAKHLVHKVMAKEKHKRKEKKMEQVLKHGQHLHHMLRQFGEMVLNTDPDKPTLNPEKIGMYEDDNKRNRPTMMGTKKFVIEQHANIVKDKLNEHPLLDYLTLNSKNKMNFGLNRQAKISAKSILYGNRSYTPPFQSIRLPEKRKQEGKNNLNTIMKNVSDYAEKISKPKYDQEHEEEEEYAKKMKSESKKAQGFDTLEFLNSLEDKIGQERIAQDESAAKANNKKKLSNFERAAKSSMEKLYARIDKAVAKVTKKREKSITAKRKTTSKKQLVTKETRQSRNDVNSNYFKTMLVSKATNVYNTQGLMGYYNQPSYGYQRSGYPPYNVRSVNDMLYAGMPNNVRYHQEGK